MKSAVCLLYPRNDGTFLSVSRRDDITKWGLPGGKVDKGESNVEAIQREVYEEIGIASAEVFYEPLYCGPCKGDVDYWVTTYLWNDIIYDDTRFDPEIGLAIEWKSIDELCDENVSPFAKYNRKVFEALNIMRQL